MQGLPVSGPDSVTQLLPPMNTVAGGGVVVGTGEGVVVEANIIIIIHSMTHLPTPDSPVTSVVTVTSPVTTAKNPLLVTTPSEVNLTVMVVAVTGPGVEVPENVWVVEPVLTSTVS